MLGIKWLLVVQLLATEPATKIEAFDSNEACFDAAAHWQEQAHAWHTRSHLPTEDAPLAVCYPVPETNEEIYASR